MRCACLFVVFAVFACAAAADYCSMFNASRCYGEPGCTWCRSWPNASNGGVCYNYTASQCCAAQFTGVACSRSEKCCGEKSHLATCCGVNKTCCGGQCCRDDEICDPTNGCLPATFNCTSANHAYVVKCKTSLEECCGDDTMNPSCLPINSTRYCCQNAMAATTCESNQECCGGGGPGASSSAFCCIPGARCCSYRGFGYCCKAGTTCCSGECCPSGQKCVNEECR